MKIGFMTHKHQYNTWQQMKRQGHICREPTGMNIYLYVGRILEVSQAPPMYQAAEPSRAPRILIAKHTHPHRHTGSWVPLQYGGKAGTETQRVLTANPNSIKPPHCWGSGPSHDLISSGHPFPSPCTPVPP